MAAQVFKSCVSLASLCKQFTVISLSSVRCLTTSHVSRSVEEFFPQGVFEKDYEPPIPNKVEHGRRWKAAEIRSKSNEDVHKLWYVLLKERNMLNTVMWECRRQGMPMPSPHRYNKVKVSMKMIRTVLGERERALDNITSRVWPFELTEDGEAPKKEKRIVQRSPRRRISRKPLRRKR